MKQVSFHRLAGEEYRRARNWYRERSLAVCDRFCDAVENAVQRIATNPEMFPVIGKSFRRVRVNRFPYVLVFKPDSHDELLVIAVAHTSRKLGYWRRRESTP